MSERDGKRDLGVDMSTSEEIRVRKVRNEGVMLETGKKNVNDIFT